MRAIRRNCSSTDSIAVKIALLVFRVVVFASLAACSHLEKREITVATLTGPNGGYYLNGWYTTTNAWGSSALKYGTDYTIGGTYDSSNITKGVSFTWNFGALPSNPDAYEILAYPSINYGQDPWDTAIDPAEQPFPLKISDIQKFDASYNVSYGGQTQGYNVSFDLYVSNNPTGGQAAITDEIMVWMHTGGFNPGTPITSYTDGNGNAGQIYNFWADGLGWEYSAFLTNSDTPAGTIDVAGLLKKLVSLGIISSSEYVEKIDIGAEVAAGSGNLTINNVGYNIQMAGQSAVTLGTPNSGTGTGGSTGGGTGTGGGTTTPPPPPPPVATANRFLEPDFNKDGNSDILFQNTNGQVKLWTMSGTKELAYNVIGSGSTAQKLICAADFDGDGNEDVLFQNTSGQAQIWFMSSATGVRTTANLGTNPGKAWQIVSVGDFNGDAKADIVWQNTSTGQAMVWLVNGTTVTGSATLGNSPGATWKVIGAGDVNGNNKSDIIWQNTSGQVMIYTMNGTTVTSKATVSKNPGSSWKAVGTGDFNGDGNSDILFQNTNGQVRLWEMNGSTILLDKTISTNPGSAWSAVGAEDFNNDGKDDILFQNKSTGEVMVWMMNGGSIASQGIVGNPDLGWHAVVGG
jgi:hypothetical protein